MDEIVDTLNSPPGDEAHQKALLKLCNFLSMGSNYDLLPAVPSLVRIIEDRAAGPDVVLLAVRAVTYYFDVVPNAAAVLVGHGALPVLLNRLLSIDYIDVAEQCIQALECIASVRPAECLRMQMVPKVLAYIDFFSDGTKRAAISAVAKACTDAPKICFSLVKEVVPCLVNLLQYGDKNLVESVANCLTQIAGSSTMPRILDELLREGLHQKALCQMDLSLSQASRAALVRLLTKLASRSIVVVKALFELNVGSTIQRILTDTGLSHSAAPSPVIYEVLNLVNELVPPAAASNIQDMRKVFAKEQVLNDHPNLLRQFAKETMPFLMRAANSGMSLYGSYICVTIMDSIASLAKPEMLREVLAGTNVAAFLTSLLARKDRHLLFVTIKVVEVLMKKLSKDFLDPFVKQGVHFALHRIAKHGEQPAKPCQESVGAQKTCLCYMLDSGKSGDGVKTNKKRKSEGEDEEKEKSCKVEDHALFALARVVKQTYFTHDALRPMTDSSESMMQSLQSSCNELDEALVQSNNRNGSSEDDSSRLMGDLMMELYCGEEMTPFEFLETGLVWSVANYLCSGEYLKWIDCGDNSDRARAVMRKFRSFAGVCLSGIERDWETTVLTLLVRKLQGTCSCLDIFEDALNAAPPTVHDPKTVSADEPMKDADQDETGCSLQNVPFFDSMVLAELPSEIDRSSPLYDTLFVLKVLEGINRFAHHILSDKEINKFARGDITNLDNLKVAITPVPPDEFVSANLTDMLEQEMQDPSFSSSPRFKRLLSVCPFLLSFDARCAYFHKTAVVAARNPGGHGDLTVMYRPVAPQDRLRLTVDRRNILQAAAEMMKYAVGAKPVEIQYNGELGTGAGPTAEFYTLVSHEFQKAGLGMWRGELHNVSGFVASPRGLFPRPWSAAAFPNNGDPFSEVKKKFDLLGQFVAKAVKESQVLDIPFSKAFYKLILGQKLSIYDIQSFDPELGRTLLEFQALAERRKFLNSTGSNHAGLDLDFRGCQIEDLGLDFGTLPGYPDCPLQSEGSSRAVTIENLDEYVHMLVDATIGSGVANQVQAFRSGFNKICPVSSLQVFSEDELDLVLCGEQDNCDLADIDTHVAVDHGYTARSIPVIHLLEIIQEFDCQQRRAFLQFVTGAPRLPPGGLGTLNPKLTVVCKHSDNADTELPSVMTCTNYLKLPPYSSKNTMRQRLLYAVTEGQGSFDFS